MDLDKATLIVSGANRAARELSELVHLLEPADEKLKLAIAAAIYGIMENVATPLLGEHPELRSAVDRRIDRYGRAF